jgi:hypothetical protein
MAGFCCEVEFVGASRRLGNARNPANRVLRDNHRTCQMFECRISQRNLQPHNGIAVKGERHFSCTLAEYLWSIYVDGCVLVVGRDVSQ